MDLTDLVAKLSGDAAIGLGLASGDIREAALVKAVDFARLQIFSDAASLLDALGDGTVAAGVRGSLPSTGFLYVLRRRHSQVSLRRVALMVQPGGEPFLLGPVGIDEGGTLEAARELAGDMREFCRLLGWEAKIGVLSAGRAEDGGRSQAIASSIAIGEAAAAEAGVRHFNIMIEEALAWANCVIAPNGVTGNLVYRTLAHVGAGLSLGALYFPLSLRLADTSRNGTVEEYVGAVALAALAAAGQD